MIKVKARGNESVEQMIRRFKKMCEKEGLVKDIKRNRRLYDRFDVEKRINRVREMMKMDLSINQIPSIVHKNKYSVIQYFDCKDTTIFESQGFHIKELTR